MNRNRVSRVYLLLFLSPLVISAQTLRDVAPLKYWPAPLYWQPTLAEKKVTTGSDLFNVTKDSASVQPPAQTPANSLVFVAITPCRLVDTRTGFGFTGAFGPPSLAGAASRAFPIRASTTWTIPATAQAYSLNITAVPPGPLTYLTIWPIGASQPNASTLNDTLGGIVANAAIVPAGSDGSGSVNVFVSDPTNLVIDINGYYTAQSGITLTQGAAGAPSLSFASDPTTGIFSSGAATVDIATGGISRLTVRSDGDVDLPGSIRKSGTLFLHNLGTNNTAVGLNALNPSTSGTQDTAIGAFALVANTTGSSNTGIGESALFANTTGFDNTATGSGAFLNNTTGNGNTAYGAAALSSNIIQPFNTAIGAGSLTGSIGAYNTAVGALTLINNSNGFDNTAVGAQALYYNTTGFSNTAVGEAALQNLTTGTNNIAIGNSAGVVLAGGNSNNIEIGHMGSVNDSNTIRIGAPAVQTSFFVAGVRGITTASNNAVPVVIDSNGQLGTVSSSIRFKEDVHDMADASSGVLRLRPVTYRYKQPYADGSKPIDYGLIAEEVAEIYPDLVVKNADGQVETVQYQKLTPMLLNELQRQHRETDQKTAALEEQIRLLQAELGALKALLPRTSEK